jgi:hypothetical protein
MNEGRSSHSQVARGESSSPEFRLDRAHHCPREVKESDPDTTLHARPRTLQFEQRTRMRNGAHVSSPCQHGSNQPLRRSLQNTSRNTNLIRVYGRFSSDRHFDAKLFLGVDHHARACWWSTSESSEKCPRVLRGKTSVPSENAKSFDLSCICWDFEGALILRHR